MEVFFSIAMPLVAGIFIIAMGGHISGLRARIRSLEEKVNHQREDQRLNSKAIRSTDQVLRQTLREFGELKKQVNKSAEFPAYDPPKEISATEENVYQDVEEECDHDFHVYFAGPDPLFQCCTKCSLIEYKVGFVAFDGESVVPLEQVPKKKRKKQKNCLHLNKTLHLQGDSVVEYCNDCQYVVGFRNNRGVPIPAKWDETLGRHVPVENEKPKCFHDNIATTWDGMLECVDCEEIVEVRDHKHFFSIKTQNGRYCECGRKQQ